MHSIHYINRIPSSLRGELESVFYFNLRQQQYSKGISVNVEKYGEIVINNVEDGITLEYKSRPACQTLFAVDSLAEHMALLGVVGYTISEDVCEVVHIAVTPSCAVDGEYGDEFVALRLLEKVRKIAKEKRMKYIRLPYRDRVIPVEFKFIEVYE